MHNKKSMQELEAALKSLFDNAQTSHASIAGVITKDNEAQLYVLGDEEYLEALVSTAINHIAQRKELTVFDVTQSIQSKLAMAHPKEFKEFTEKIEGLRPNSFSRKSNLREEENNE